MVLCKFCGDYWHRVYFRFCYHCAFRLLDEVEGRGAYTDEEMQDVMILI